MIKEIKKGVKATKNFVNSAHQTIMNYDERVLKNIMGEDEKGIGLNPDASNMNRTKIKGWAWKK